MKVSVVTACYNAAKTLSRTLESVQSQVMSEGIEIEHIVVDGGSKDGTVDLLHSFAATPTRQLQNRGCDVHDAGTTYTFRWLSEKDRGLYDAINKGIRMATGEVVGILNADDWFDGEDVIASVVREFGEGVDCVYGDIRFVKVERVESDSRGEVERCRGEAEKKRGRGKETTVRYYSAKRWKPWMFQWGKMPPHPGVYLRRECFEKFGWYKLGYQIAADYELLIRFLRKNAIRVRYLDKCLVCMSLGGKSTKNWKSNLILNREIVRGNRENGYFCCLPMLVPKYAFKIWEFVGPKFGGYGAKKGSEVKE